MQNVRLGTRRAQKKFQGSKLHIKGARVILRFQMALAPLIRDLERSNFYCALFVHSPSFLILENIFRKKNFFFEKGKKKVKKKVKKR